MKNNSASIIGAGKKEDRQVMDFYPTPSEVTIALMDFLKLPVPSKIWEPACGEGAMAKIISSYGHTVWPTDIRKTDYCLLEHNFLKTTEEYKMDAIITNPPFNTAHRFILQALKLAPVVAMVLKSQYWHAAKRQHIFIKHPPAWILPLTWRPDFLGGGASQLDCLWTVWIDGDIMTKYKPLMKPNYEFKGDHLSDFKKPIVAATLFS